MDLRIDPTSGEPVYRQLVWQVKRAVARGDLLSGERLPSVRELAGRLLINPNTIARAYREMEGEGLICGQPGRGYFVTAEGGRELSEAVRERVLTELVEKVIVEARYMGVSAEALGKVFEAVIRGMGK